MLARRDKLLFPWKIVWKFLAPCRVAFLAWEVVNEAILTSDSLRRRRKIYVNWCFMYKGNGESINHLMIHSPVVTELWNLVFGLLNLSWDQWKNFWSWSLYKRRRRDGLWEAVPLGVRWTIWKERNHRVFENEESSTQLLKNTLLRTLMFWCFVEAVNSIWWAFYLLAKYTPSQHRTCHLFWRSFIELFTYKKKRPR